MSNFNKSFSKFKKQLSHKRAKKPIVDVTFDDGTFVFYHLNHPKVVSQFIEILRKRVSQGTKSFLLDFSRINNQIFPNAITPIAGIIDYYRDKDISFDFSDCYSPSIVRQSRLLDPTPFDNSSNVLNKVWKFSSSDEVAKLVDAYISELSKNDLST